MPQPLSRVKPDASIIIGNSGIDPFEHHPDLAQLAMRVVAEWSNLESFLINAFIKMSGTSAAVAAAILSELTGTAAKIAAIRAVAGINLNQEQYERFQELLGLYSTAAKSRNKIVHWVWGYSPHLDDALLLGDPKVMADFSLRLNFAMSEYMDNMRKGKFSKLVLPKMALESIFVYRANDFENIISEIVSLTGRFALFTFTLPHD